MATVVRSESRGLSKPAVYTFLGLASLPRFRGRARDGPRTRGARRAANPLRLLPREIVRHIARFAYRAGYRAYWVEFSNFFSDDQPVQLSIDEEVAVALDVTEQDSTSETGETDWVAHLSPMVSGKTYYVEVRLTHAWWGTGLALLGLGQRFRFVLNNNGAGADMAARRRTGQIACFGPGPANEMLSMPSLGVDSWSYCEAPVTMSVLVDLVRGCATFGLNGLAGPCVRFPPGSEWRDGVQIATSPGCIPMASVLGRSLGGRCIVSCATPPTPPSMLAAASHPMTAAEHLAAGSMRIAPVALIAFVGP